MHADPQDSDSEKDYWKGIVLDETVKFESEYDTLMYGGYAITQVSSWCCDPMAAHGNAG